MVYTPPVRSPVSASRVPPAPAAPTPQRGASERRQTVATLFQRSDGRIGEARHTVPAVPEFTAAFSAFAHGTLITTAHGPVAVEDLRPGMAILTNERGPEALLWIGSMLLRPGDMPDGQTRLSRITTDALGPGRPMVDLMAGPDARIVQRGSGPSGQVLRPVNDLVDGNSVIALSPPGPVHLYHIALRRHATITAAGLAVETYHPGPGFETAVTLHRLSEFLALFPHIHRPSDFGSLAHPRRPLCRDSA
ncbi:MAG TPA: Hint domain-containing protein [Roseovarius sp.]